MKINSETIKINQELMTMSATEVAEYYLSIPVLPYRKVGLITKIGVFRGSKYGDFRKLAPQEFPKGSDPKTDYMDDEIVSPVVLFFKCEDNAERMFRVDQVLWFALHDIHNSVHRYQFERKRKVFPIRVCIDDNNTWLAPLFHAVHNYLPKSNTKIVGNWRYRTMHE